MHHEYDHKYKHGNAMKNTQKGFSLIELMVAVAVLGIITAIAIPSYTSFKLKANRGEAKSALLDVAARLEEYYSENREYTNDMKDIKLSATTTSKISTTNGYYEIQNSETANPTETYFLTATPKDTQSSDKVIFILDDDGEKFHYYAGTTAPDTNTGTPNGWEP